MHDKSLNKIIESDSLMYGVTEIWGGNSLIPTHSHQDRHQLIYAVKGTIRIQTEKGYWILPPLRAIWIESHIEHSFYAKHAVEVHILYIRKNIDENLTYKDCCVFNVSNLVKELVISCMEYKEEYKDHSPQGRLSYVLLEQLQKLDQSPVNIPYPNHSKLKVIWHLFENNPDTQMSLKELANLANASERTIERLFVKETGMLFSEWRYKFRLIKSLEYLAEQQPISEIAYNVGYEHVSSYIAAFRKFFGCTPRQYFK